MRRELRDDGFRGISAILLVVVLAVIAAIVVGIYVRAQRAGLLP